MPTFRDCNHLLRIAGIAVAATLASACNVGLDPRHFERVEYGVDRAQLEAAVEIEGAVAMRFFLPAPDGRHGDYAWLALKAQYPHPDYAALLQDDRFVALRQVPPQLHPNFNPELPTWTSTELATRVHNAIANRLSLRWQDLEPFDSSLPKPGPHPTLAGFGELLLNLPGLVLLPIAWPVHEWLMGDIEERREHVVKELLAIAPAASYEEVVARIGEPTATHGDLDGADVTECVYQIRNGNRFMPGVLLGFEARRLVWIDFHWYDTR
jgi:hypothetical protein